MLLILVSKSIRELPSTYSIYFFIDPNIRQIVLSSLDDRFDKHLAQAEYVRSLFIALNDEIFGNRVLAIALIGRLAMHNPAYVMPSLRKALIQLLTELEYSTITCVFFLYSLSLLFLNTVIGGAERKRPDF